MCTKLQLENLKLKVNQDTQAYDGRVKKLISHKYGLEREVYSTEDRDQ